MQYAQQFRILAKIIEIVKPGYAHVQLQLHRTTYAARVI